MQIGTQFFTLRDHCQNLDDFAESLKKVADIGYKTVQISGVCAYEPEWLKEQLDKNGLKCVVTHTNLSEGNAAKLAADHDVFGCKYMGLGFYPLDPEQGKGYDEFVKTYMPVAKILKDSGKYFMYHNHSREFIKLDGKLILQRMSEDFSPELMGFILDTYWIQVGGGDPAQWIEKFSGRVPCIHLKDYAFDAKMAPVGEGNINFDRVFEKAESSGTKYMLVEQDQCYGEDPFDCLKRSYDFLTSLGLD